jgi:hypothetical protein
MANRVRTSAEDDRLFIVTSEWVGGAFTALGAALGASATLAAGLVGNKTQRGLAAATRKSQIAEARRESYAEYLTATYSFMDRARELIAKLESDNELSECDIAHRSYLDDWDRLQPAYAPVLVAGPSQIEESAEALRFCLGDLADKCDNWIAARRNGRRLYGKEKVYAAQQAAREARSKFSSAARDYVYG